MFDIVKGYPELKNFFLNAYKKEKMHTTYLFKGREGIGKKLFAKVVSAMILCENEENSPCGFCRHCLKVKGMIEDPLTPNPHLDLVEIGVGEGKNEITVEDVEPILKLTSFPPYEGRARIFIIDNCHLMNRVAANMVLKTLEEPPENTYFFLITAKPDSLLPTILSRCEQVYFNPKDLEEYMKIEGYSKEQLKAFLNAGSGFLQNKEDIEAIKRDRQAALIILKSLLNNEIFINIEKQVQALIEDNNREDNNRVFFNLYTLLRDILAYKSGSEVINTDLEGDIKSLSDKVSPDFVFELIEIIKKAQTGLNFNLKPLQMISLIITEGRRIAK